MIHWFLTNPIGQQIIAGVVVWLIIAIIGLLWAARWKFPKTREDRRKLDEIHNQIVDQPEVDK